jgi:hypothetical protein
MPSEKDPLVVEYSYGTADEAAKDEVEPAPLFQRVKETLLLYWHLGFIAFGGPTAHVAILRDHLVRVHKFIEEEVFVELFALGTYQQFGQDMLMSGRRLLQPPLSSSQSI